MYCGIYAFPVQTQNVTIDSGDQCLVFPVKLHQRGFTKKCPTPAACNAFYCTICSYVIPISSLTSTGNG